MNFYVRGWIEIVCYIIVSILYAILEENVMIQIVMSFIFYMSK